MHNWVTCFSERKFKIIRRFTTPRKICHTVTIFLQVKFYKIKFLDLLYCAPFWAISIFGRWNKPIEFWVPFSLSHSFSSFSSYYW